MNPCTTMGKSRQHVVVLAWINKTIHPSLLIYMFQPYILLYQYKILGNWKSNKLGRKGNLGSKTTISEKRVQEKSVVDQEDA